ncbi:hypothetical protein HUN39_05475 [Methylocystis sp. FS]|uniref:hypothetical protein n=1 Tax=Methylocystis silviterrae TaxID=2743612 RepID=UPI001581AC71|nr:hypothetical protein [Methylocystis silviterrae]NUJ79475.1 hypothetical protein [Methylocystis silviterrae]
MSVTLEKRRKVAELENFERRILQEKRRLLRELESLEKPFRNTRAMAWIKDFSSDVAGEWRAVQGAASFRAPIWFYVVAGAILLGGVGGVATLALRGAPAPRADGATLRQVETPTTPVRIEPPPAPVTEAAQAVDVAPSSALTVSAPPDTIASPAPSTPDSKELKERLLEAQAAAEPLPEPLPPPQKTDVPAAAPALGAATVPPLGAALPKTAFDDAPPVDAAATAEPDEEAPATRKSQREDEPADEGRRAKCFVKVDGRVLFERSCMLRQPTRSTLTLNAGDDAVVLTQDHGRTWTASLGGRSLGKVYRTGACWGRRRQVFICAKGA